MDTKYIRGSRIWLVATALSLAVAATYHAAPTHDFIKYDDPQYVTQSTITQQGFSIEGVTWAFTDTSTGNWHPLTRLSHMADCALFGVNAGAHHSVNVLLHILNSALLLLTLNRMTGALWRSAFVAGLFALHPLHVESVAWISERKDVLSGFFWIATMYAYAAYAERVSIVRYVFVALLLALGLMAKPMVVTLPAVLLLLDIWPLKRLNAPIGFTRDFAKCFGQLILEKVPLFILSVGAAILTLALQQHALNESVQLSLLLRTQNAMAAYWIYLQQTFFPRDLTIFYPHPLNSLEASVWMTGAAVLLVGSIASCALIKRTPYVFVGWWWFVGTLLPVIGVIQVGLQGWADRYTYLPHIGLFIALVWAASDGLAKWKIPKPLVAVGATVILIVFGVISVKQHAYWKNTITVFENSLRVTENNKLAHLILGVAEVERGDLVTAQSHFYAAIKIDGDAAWAEGMPEGHYALGLMAEGEQDWEEAANQYRKSIELNDMFSEAHNNLAGVYMEFGRLGQPEYFEQARIHAYRAFELDSQNEQAAANAAFLALHLKDYDDAVRYHELAVPHFPHNAPMHRNMGLALFESGDVSRALEYAGKALAIDPAFAQAQADVQRYTQALAAN